MTARCQNQQSQLGWLIFLHLLLIFDWRAGNRQIKMSNYLSWSLCKKEFFTSFWHKNNNFDEWLTFHRSTNLQCNQRRGRNYQNFSSFKLVLVLYRYFSFTSLKCQSTEKQLCFYTTLKHLLNKRWHLGKVSFQNIWENVTFNRNG